MSNQLFNFYYDPIRQGYDSNTWSTLIGAPVVVGNKLSLDGAGILHFADLLRGDVTFNINMATPQAGDDVKIGLTEYNKGAFLYFKVADDILTAESSDGTTTYSVAIDWNTDWNGADTEFRIKWEAGTASFSIGGNIKATLSETITLDIPITAIPGDPMSLYVHNDSAGALLIKYIEVKGVESSILSLS